VYVLNESRIKLYIERFDLGNNIRMQFLIAVGHNVGAHIKSLHSGINEPEDDESTTAVMFVRWPDGRLSLLRPIAFYT
jgi:hypothetical protein